MVRIESKSWSETTGKTKPIPAVLRNQLIHGGATWNSSVNRSQVKDGAALLGVLLPIFIDILMDNPGNDWGRPYYPVVD